MSFSFKVSKPGYDVLTCGSENLVLDSDLDTLKTALVGTTSSSVAHGLAYVPCYFAMNQLSSTHWGIVGQAIYDVSTITIDATKFYSTSGVSKYYIFYQQNV